MDDYNAFTKDIMEKEYIKTIISDFDLNSETITIIFEDYKRIKEIYAIMDDFESWIIPIMLVNKLKSAIQNDSKFNSLTTIQLNDLLLKANSNVRSIFAQSSKLSDMIKCDISVKSLLSNLERTFNVSMIIYHKYNEITAKIFNKIELVDSVKKFLWFYFILSKSFIPTISEDLLSCYHLMICCIDSFFFKQLLNFDQDIFSKDLQSFNDDKGVYKHSVVVNFIQSIGNPFLYADYCVMKNNLSNISVKIGKLNSNIEDSIIKLNEIYASQLKSTLMLDERNFFYNKFNCSNDSNSLNQEFHNISFNSGPNEDGCSANDSANLEQKTPISTAKALYTSFDGMLYGYDENPTAKLQEIFSSCYNNPFASIQEVIKSVKKIFCEIFINKNINETNLIVDNDRRWVLSLKLYYKLLEKILVRELNKNPKYDLSFLLEQKIFHRCLLTCSILIVSYIVLSKNCFPWMLQPFDIHPFNFYKIIELIVRVEESFKRNLIKYLAWVEETIVECLAWKKDSPLFQMLNHSDNMVPSFEECVPSMSCPSTPIKMNYSTFFKNNCDETNDEKRSKGVHLDVSNKPVTFLSPDKSVHHDVSSFNFKAKRSLFPNDDSKNDPPTFSFQPADTNIVVVDKHFESVNKSTTSKKKSLLLFFRKLYHISSNRFNELCSKLDMSEDIKAKIWTFFEILIKRNINIFKERHLDQIILSSIYVISRLSDKPFTFYEILKFYRKLANSSSVVYRSVLIDPVNETRSDIIIFYNEVFIQEVNRYLPEFTINNNEWKKINISPLPKFKTKCTPRKVVDNLPIYISPIKNSKSNDLKNQKPIWCYETVDSFT